MDRLESSFIGLGANVGDPAGTMARAVRALAALPGASISGISRIYRTRPVGPVVQAGFLNAVVALEVPAGPHPTSGAMALLRALKELERALGREDRERWGPREIDLDLLLFGSHRLHIERATDARSEDPARVGPQWLDVPHVAARDRLFVLAPLADLAPELEPPGWGMTVGEACLRAHAIEGATAVAVLGSWDAGAGGWLDPSGGRPSA